MIEQILSHFHESYRPIIEGIIIGFAMYGFVRTLFNLAGLDKQ